MISLGDRYQEPHRSYHTTNHIMEMLVLFSERFLDRQEFSDVEQAAILLAIWYHDAIYNPQVQDNEEQSALLAQTELQEEVDAAVVENVMRLVRSTAAHNPQQGDEKVLSDLDLAILGSSRERYEEYTDQIQKEYAFVSWENFREVRANILQGFLDREQIFYYLTDLEEPARANIVWELAFLWSY